MLIFTYRNASIYVLNASIMYDYDALIAHVFKKFIFVLDKKKNPYFHCKVISKQVKFPQSKSNN